MTTPPALSRKQTIFGQFIRDVVFGTNDALLTNIGIITGFTASLVSNRLIILAVLVDVFTSAFAMATGTYLSRTSEDDYFAASLTKQTKSGVDKALANPYIASVVMWVVYVISGMIPLIPFFFGLPPTTAAKITVVLGALTFLIVGVFKAKVTNTSVVKSAAQFFILGTVAALIGYGIGVYASKLGIS
jgi:VIT1/CCC1 family predicted Fe2+/Mn2+ transporter